MNATSDSKATTSKDDDQVRLKHLLDSVAHANALVVQAHLSSFPFALDTLGNLDLPDVAPRDSGDQAQLRSIASLYLAAQLEKASLVTTVEDLAGLGMTGGLPFDLGKATPLLTAFWHDRNQRFGEKERLAFFARLFGSDDDGPGAMNSQASNSQFENLMIDLCEGLYKLDESAIGNQPMPDAVARIETAGLALTENLVQRANGMTAFAARDILHTIQIAIRVLQVMAQAHVFGARTLWDVVRTTASRYLNREAEIDTYLQRGRSGMVVLSWMADKVGRFHDAVHPLLGTDNPVIAAAMDWLQSSLSVHEHSAPVGAAPGGG
jgi:hypothetical protein